MPIYSIQRRFSPLQSLNGPVDLTFFDQRLSPQWVGWMQSVFLLIALLLSTVGAHAQSMDLTTGSSMAVPSAAQAAVLRASPESMTVMINGQVERLAPGAHIRNSRRLLVLPAHLGSAIGPGDVRAFVEREPSGQIIRIWLPSVR